MISLNSSSQGKFSLVSLGCPKNLVDSEQTIALLENAGYIFTQNLADSSIILINTCGFIDSSKRESVDTILEIAQYKKKGKCKKIIVMGCLVQLYKEKLLKEMPEIDAVIGVSDYHSIVKIINELKTTKHYIQVSSPDSLPQSSILRHLCTLPHIAYVKISEGCDHLCSYCIIPQIRGKQRSRSIDDILNEVNSLVKQGVREIVLIGQDLTDYGRDIYGNRCLPELLYKLNEVKKLSWIRLLYAYPNLVTDDLIFAIRDCEKVVKYIDMPLQHISNSILKSMNRPISKQKIVNLVEKLRNEIPNIIVRTTFIVGYPGETQSEFNELKSFVLNNKLEHVGVFTFSREKGTPSYLMKPQIRKSVKDIRYNELMEIQQNIVKMHNMNLLGKTVDVIIDWIDDDGIADSIGRTYGQAPDIDGITYIVSLKPKKAKPGQIVKAVIQDYDGYDLYAKAL